MLQASLLAGPSERCERLCSMPPVKSNAGAMENVNHSGELRAPVASACEAPLTRWGTGAARVPLCAWIPSPSPAVSGSGAC